MLAREILELQSKVRELEQRRQDYEVKRQVAQQQHDAVVAECKELGYETNEALDQAIKEKEEELERQVADYRTHLDQFDQQLTQLEDRVK
jgi:prefoldin subunit 5